MMRGKAMPKVKNYDDYIEGLRKHFKEKYSEPSQDCRIDARISGNEGKSYYIKQYEEDNESHLVGGIANSILKNGF
jgi:hypothetical protein